MALFVFGYLLFVIGLLLFTQASSVVWLLIAVGFLIFVAVHTIYYLLFYFIVVDVIDIAVKKSHLFILPMLYCFILMFTNGILKGNMDAFPFAAIFIVDISYVIYLKVRKDPSIESLSPIRKFNN